MSQDGSPFLKLTEYNSKTLFVYNYQKSNLQGKKANIFYKNNKLGIWFPPPLRVTLSKTEHTLKQL